ncbi:hypothetical protein ACVD13_24545, partial [Escherichia coli]
GQPDNPVSSTGEGITPPYLPPRHFAGCHNRKRTVELNLTTPYSETNFAVRFRVVCLLLTTSGEVVSFLSRITKKEIYMTKEEFVSYIFDKTVEMYAATYGSCNPLNKPEGKDDFDKIYPSWRTAISKG